MDLLGGGLFDLAEKRLLWLDQRQQVLAQNIANADTPDYQARDLTPFRTLLAQSVAPVPLAAPRAGDLPGDPAQAMPIDTWHLPDGRAPDGNAVSMPAELTREAQTEDAQQLVTNLYEAYAGMVRTAIGKN
jgi:flagellar basal-body rod protein FlgB